MIHRRLPQTEFIVLAAMMFATIAFSIDAMLPALPVIGAALTPDDMNRAQLIVTAFVFGMGIGTLFSGPLADAFGRKPIILGGMALYIVGAVLAARADSIELLLAARVLQGLGAAGPRIATLALIRDLYKGAEMARISSFVMMVFVLVPAIAPLIGQAIMFAFGWRAIFLAFVVFSLIGSTWMTLRQSETITPENRRALSFAALRSAMKEMFSIKVVVISLMAQTLIYTMLFAVISTIQPLFDVTFDKANSFPLWFGAIAVISGSGSFINARMVEHHGMRRMVTAGFFSQIIASAIVLLLLATTGLPFFAFFLWMLSCFFMVGFTIGNLNALALEPLPHIAGFASSIIGAISTVLAAILAALVGQAFNGTAMPLAISIFICTTLAYGLMVSLGPRAPVPETI